MVKKTEGVQAKNENKKDNEHHQHPNEQSGPFGNYNSYGSGMSLNQSGPGGGVYSPAMGSNYSAGSNMNNTGFHNNNGMGYGNQNQNQQQMMMQNQMMQNQMMMQQQQQQQNQMTMNNAMQTGMGYAIGSEVGHEVGRGMMHPGQGIGGYGNRGGGVGRRGKSMLLIFVICCMCLPTIVVPIIAFSFIKAGEDSFHRHSAGQSNSYGDHRNYQ